jgi:hypothetical protein
LPKISAKLTYFWIPLTSSVIALIILLIKMFTG